jgi:hypothetical protein
MKNLISILLIFFSGNICFSQDIIFKKNKAFIQAKVIDSNASEIKYKLYFNQDGPTYVILKTDLLKINYETGILENYKDFVAPPFQYFKNNGEVNKTDSINENIESPTENNKKYIDDEIKSVPWENKDIDYYFEGERDAVKHYQDYKGASTFTYLVSSIPIAGIFFGLFPMALFSSIPPPNQNLNYPNEKLMTNADYHYAYNKKAYQIKKNKVLKNYSLGVLTGLSLIVIFAAK